MYIEDKLIDEQYQQASDLKEKVEKYEKTGEWLSNSENKEEEDSLFDKIKF